MGGQDTRMQAFKLPLIMDAPPAITHAAAANSTAVADSGAALDAAPHGAARTDGFDGAPSPSLGASNGLNVSSAALAALLQQDPSAASAAARPTSLLKRRPGPALREGGGDGALLPPPMQTGSAGPDSLRARTGSFEVFIPEILKAHQNVPSASCSFENEMKSKLIINIV